MTEREYDHQKTPTLTLFIINVLVALIWTAFAAVSAFFDFVVGFVFGTIAISLLERDYIRSTGRVTNFILYVLWAILVSNFQLAWTIIQPGKRLQQRLDPGIVSVPLAVDTPLEIIVLATVITLTPGTLSVNLGENERGEQVLFVHNLSVNDPQAFRREIKENFERRLMHVTRGGANA